jgi:4-amino-4-deoxy-L-arabinose transferase-like glycosyltransferase
VFNNHPLFASWQSVWWALGGEGEARQRLFPVLYGALAVALLAGWLTRRVGVLGGAAAGAVLMLNPMFVTQSRAVRGYSLATMCVVIAMITLVEYVRREQAEPRSGGIMLLVGHAAAVVVAMGTHLFSGIVLGAVGVGALVVLRRFDRRLWASWVAAAVGVVAVYYPTFDELRTTAEQRGTDFKPWFGRVATWEVLGTDRLTGTILAGLAVVGVGLLIVGRVSTRRRVGVATAVVVLLVLTQAWYVWQIAQPLDLYPRFFLTVVPLVGVAVGVTIAKLPWLVPLLVIGLVATWGNVATARRSSSPIRETAAVVRTADELGLQSCVVGGWPMRVYGAYARELDAQAADSDAQLRACDVFVRIGGWGRTLLEPARDQFPYETRIGGFEVFSAVPSRELGL